MPFLFANLLQALYNVADMVIVGNFGAPGGLGGVGLGGQVTMLVIQVTNGLSVGGTVLVAQYIGAKREEDEREVVGTLFTLFAILSVVLTVVMLAVHVPILRLLNTPEENFKEAADYLAICLSGTVFIMGYNAVSAILRGMGDSKRPLLFVAIATIVNVVLDLLFVAVFDWSAAGAAAATVIAQAVSFIFSVAYLRKIGGFSFDFKLKSFKIYKDKLALLFKIGLPMAIQGMITSLSFLTLTGLVNSFGSAALNVSSVAGRVNSFAILPNIAFSSAISAMAGQNIGAGEHARAKKTMLIGMRLALGCAVIMTVLIFFFPEQILAVFGMSVDGVGFVTLYFRFIAMDYLFTAVLFSMNGLLMGAGHTNITMINSLINSIFLRVPLAYIFALACGLGMPGVALGISMSTLGPMITNFFYIQSGKWKKARIDHSSEKVVVAE